MHRLKIEQAITSLLEAYMRSIYVHCNLDILIPSIMLIHHVMTIILLTHQLYYSQLNMGDPLLRKAAEQQRLLRHVCHPLFFALRSFPHCNDDISIFDMGVGMPSQCNKKTFSLFIRWKCNNAMSNYRTAPAIVNTLFNTFWES